jgi:hypothetical protein
MASLGLLAAKPVNMDLVWATLALLGAVFLGILVMWFMKRWWQEPVEVLPPAEQAKTFRTLYEEGVLSQEEFAKIRLQLEKKAQAQAAAPSAPPVFPAPPVQTEKKEDHG